MKSKDVWVIQDTNGNFISFQRTKKGVVYYLKFSGIATGFSSFNNEDVAKEKINVLTKKYGNIFTLKCVNSENIPRGKRIDTENELVFT